MSSIYTTIFITLFLAILCLLGLAYIGGILVQKEVMTADTLKRGIAAIAVFGVIFFSAYFDSGYVTDLQYLAAVIGGGCCWIGSNKR